MKGMVIVRMGSRLRMINSLRFIMEGRQSTMSQNCAIIPQISVSGNLIVDKDEIDCFLTYPPM